MSKMNVIFFTQSKGLVAFYRLMLSMRKFVAFDKVGFYVADSKFFKEFKQKVPEIESSSFSLLKEWEIVAESKKIKPDNIFLEKYEKKIGRPFLWDALVADRRIYFGRKYAYDQDYCPRFSHEQMLSILQVALPKLEDFFDKIQPDVIISFQCVTLGEYLSSLFAKARSIPVLNLRPTRIKNYFYAGEDIMEPSNYLMAEYNNLLKTGIEPSLRNEVMQYLQGVKDTHALYEGVVSVSNKPPEVKRRVNLFNVNGLLKLVRNECKYRWGEYHDDNHISGFIGPFIGDKLIRPWRAFVMERRLRNCYVRAKDLSSLFYTFFPLHTEPEVTLSVYSKAYLNQIEAVRLVSHNLPVGMKLIVKEHPWSIGKRPFGYYRKLLEIPNGILAHPNLTSRELLLSSRLVVAIAGSIAFEGVMLSKPVIVLGKVPFAFLPPSMIRYISNPHLLGQEIHSLLENYRYDEDALIHYVAAVMKNSVKIDFYSRLIGRECVYREQSAHSFQSEEERVKQSEKLAQYLLNRYQAFISKNSISMTA